MVTTVATDRVIITLFVLILLLAFAPCGCWQCCQHFRVTCCLHLLGWSEFMYIQILVQQVNKGGKGGGLVSSPEQQGRGIIVKTATFRATECTKRRTATIAPKQSSTRVLAGWCWQIPLHPSMPLDPEQRRLWALGWVTASKHWLAKVFGVHSIRKKGAIFITLLYLLFLLV
jgi:hypothetical protein